ncbi:MAG: hypothetical protein EHM19_08735 [Candidatus Latescibacterota bacterium]|nr:MAG: hypothetical protein EHM19_08735 [Candidatus Latescibacterota bacterium]
MIVRNMGLMVLAFGLAAGQVFASTQESLDQAARRGKPAFVLVTEPGAQGIDEAKNLVQSAMKMVPGSTLVELDRSDPANADLVAKFRLAGAPVPLILLAAGNGAIAGGMPAGQATAERLAGLAPSPKKAEILLALQEGKSVFVVASRKGMKSTTGAMSSCSMACGQMVGKSATVEIDMDDETEDAFLSQLKVDRASAEPVTLVLNAEGQITATYAGAADVTNLVQAATKRAGGCCPSSVQGGSKSCGPGK